jgi:hypothetical protein
VLDDDDFLNSGVNDVKSKRGRNIPSIACRRSTRTAILNTNGKRESSADSWQWPERRSTRRAAQHSEPESDGNHPRKRSRTVESTEGGSPAPLEGSSNGAQNGIKVKKTGAAALKPTEVAMEQVAGKKRSKYWVYAVEPVSGAVVNGHGAIPQPSNHERIESGNSDDFRQRSIESTGNAEPRTENHDIFRMSTD